MAAQPVVTASRGAAGAARRRAVGWSTGVPHSVGVTLLSVTEIIRADVGGAGAKTELPSYAHDFMALHQGLSEHTWFRAAEWLRDALGAGAPRAMLWGAVFAALVVRLNRYGPPRTQLVLSVAAAVYCVPAGLAGIPYLALAGGYAVPFLLMGGAVIVAVATRRAREAGRPRGGPAGGDSVRGGPAGGGRPG